MTPGIAPVMVSPLWTGPTPAGVPVNITSPSSKVKYWEMKLIRVGTLKIMSLVLPSCLTSPLTLHQRLTLWGSGMLFTGMKSLTGKLVSNILAMVHGEPFFLASFLISKNHFLFSDLVHPYLKVSCCHI